MGKAIESVGKNMSGLFTEHKIEMKTSLYEKMSSSLKLREMQLVNNEI